MMKKIIFSLLPVLLLAACNQSSGPTSATTDSSAMSSDRYAFKPANASEQAIYSRAFNTVVWSMPAVNSELMHESLLQAKGDYNQVVYWSGLINSKNQTLTPNPDVIYINPFYDTRKGPVVLEIPAVEGVSSLVGSVDDAWQTAIEDVGLAGVDKGKGGKYLILPPGYKDKVPAGYIPMPSDVYTGFIILRSGLTDGRASDIARAIEYGKKVKIYPYSQAANPPETVFLDLLQTEFGNVIPYDVRFFETLNSFIQREPWLTRDMAMVDQVKSIGIEKGKTFSPDARTKEILSAAARDAGKWLDEQYEAVLANTFYKDAHWAFPVNPDAAQAMMSHYADPGTYPVDARGVAYSMAYFMTKHLGTGQYYLVTLTDKEDKPLDGSKLYHLHIPPNVPIRQYWSITIYDRKTHALLKGVPYFSRASTSAGLQKNTDGSVDLYFGPKAPAGKESNWIPTNPERGFELMARFYGPEKDFFDKTWKIGDAEEVK